MLAAICPRCGSSIEPCGFDDLLAVLGLGVCIGAMAAIWLIGGKMAGHRRKPEHEVPRVARETIGPDLWNELPERWRLVILVAVLDHQPDGWAAMESAAREALAGLREIRRSARIVREAEEGGD